MEQTSDYIIIAKKSIDAFVEKAKTSMEDNSVEFMLIQAFAKWMHENNVLNDARASKTIPPQGQNVELQRQIAVAKKNKMKYIKKHDWTNANAWKEMEQDLQDKLNSR